MPGLFLNSPSSSLIYYSISLGLGSYFNSCTNSYFCCAYLYQQVVPSAELNLSFYYFIVFCLDCSKFPHVFSYSMFKDFLCIVFSYVRVACARFFFFVQIKFVKSLSGKKINFLCVVKFPTVCLKWQKITWISLIFLKPLNCQLMFSYYTKIFIIFLHCNKYTLLLLWPYTYTYIFNDSPML